MNEDIDWQAAGPRPPATHEQVDRLQTRVRLLEAALTKFVESAESYMKYHEEKFYYDLPVKPTGLWPAINTARKVFEK